MLNIDILSTDITQLYDVRHKKHTRTPPGVCVIGITDQQKVFEGTVQLVHSSQVNILLWNELVWA